jgi:hypothetical protein
MLLVQVPTTLNLLHITQNCCTVTMFVIVNIQRTASHRICYFFMIHFHTQNFTRLVLRASLLFQVIQLPCQYFGDRKLKITKVEWPLLAWSLYKFNEMVQKFLGGHTHRHDDTTSLSFFVKQGKVWLTSREWDILKCVASEWQQVLPSFSATMLWANILRCTRLNSSISWE